MKRNITVSPFWDVQEREIRVLARISSNVEHYIDRSAPGGKEHIGYIVDRTGFEEFKKWALEGVELPEIAEVTTPVYWKGVHYTK